MIDSNLLHETVLKIIQLPMNEWDKVVEMLKEIGDKDCQNGESSFSFLSVSAGQLAVYLGYRGAFGCGDHGHEAALRASEKSRKKLRKANGFSYP
jgi:hypothetical protein